MHFLKPPVTFSI